MTTSSQPNQKPTLFMAIAVMTLISGIVNIIWSFVAFTNFIGILCAPVTVLPAILGIVEIVYAAKLLSPQPQPVQPSQRIAILEVLCLVFLNFFAMVVGILALVFYNDIAVKNYFAQLNGTLAPGIIEEPAPAESELPQPEDAQKS